LTSFEFEPQPRHWLLQQAHFEDFVPKEARELKFAFLFRTAAGRSNLALALEALGAAVLAKVTNGYYRDPQEGLLLPGADAVSRLVTEFRKTGIVTDIDCMPFEAWPPLNYEEERNFRFPERLGSPSPPSNAVRIKKWWRFWA